MASVLVNLSNHMHSSDQRLATGLHVSSETGEFSYRFSNYLPFFDQERKSIAKKKKKTEIVLKLKRQSGMILFTALFLNRFSRSTTGLDQSEQVAQCFALKALQV